MRGQQTNTDSFGDWKKQVGSLSWEYVRGTHRVQSALLACPPSRPLGSGGSRQTWAGLSLGQLPEVTRRYREKRDARASAARNRPWHSSGTRGRSPSRPMERPPGLRPGAGGPWEMRERLGTGGFGNVCLYQHRVRRGARERRRRGLSERLWSPAAVSV